MGRVLWVMLLAAGIGVFSTAVVSLSPAHSGEGWKEEFESVCSRTDAAMTLSTEELKDLVGRCDRLKERIESEEESTRRVYLRRLKSCRDLYLYVLESRK
jgi:hypothetical protein